MRTSKGLRSGLVIWGAQSFRWVIGKCGAGLFKAKVENSPAGRLAWGRARRLMPGKGALCQARRGPWCAGSSGNLSFLLKHAAALWMVKT